MKRDVTVVTMSSMVDGRALFVRKERKKKTKRERETLGFDDGREQNGREKSYIKEKRFKYPINWKFYMERLQKY